MTGVEVASLVLASFPLLIQCLESYAKGVESLRRWQRYSREIKIFIRKLETFRVTYLNTTEQLLDGIVHSEEHLNEMLSNPASSLWKKPHYIDQLKSRLHRSFDNYVDTSEQILYLLKLMRENLGLDSRKVS